jgi:D-amino-acid oxidase
VTAPDVLVLGGGVSGLTCAVRLADAGFRVRLWTAAPWPATVSGVAGAIWYPFRAYPVERVEGWARQTFGVLQELAADPGCGVTMRSGRVLWRDAGTDPGLGSVPGDSVPVLEESRLAGYAFGATVAVPVVEMPIYLPWLLAQLTAQGGTVERRSAGSLEEALGVCPLVVNATGLGARELARDGSVTPIRGQVVRVENPGVEEFALDVGDEEEEDIMYVIPRSRDLVLGGTAAEGVWSAEPDPRTTRAIVERCAAVEPRLRGARVLGAAVGLRPGRPSVRLERERREGGTVIHDYGHGGSGVTVSWGCADDVVELARGA